MEPIEDFIRKNKDHFEYIEPDTNSWDAIGQELKKQPVNTAKRIWLKLAVAATMIGLVLSVVFLNIKSEQKMLAIGLEEEMQFPDLSLPSLEGNAVSVGDLKGKVVLVEFWASYCMMCTEDHCYYFKPLYQDFKNKGFEIYAVSIDENENKWVQAIERDELDWIQVSDLMGEDSPVIPNFQVENLPTNYLLDQTGKIIARNIDADQLLKTLNTLL